MKVIKLSTIKGLPISAEDVANKIAMIGGDWYEKFLEVDAAVDIEEAEDCMHEHVMFLKSIAVSEIHDIVDSAMVNKTEAGVEDIIDTVCGKFTEAACMAAKPVWFDPFIKYDAMDIHYEGLASKCMDFRTIRELNLFNDVCIRGLEISNLWDDSEPMDVEPTPVDMYDYMEVDDDDVDLRHYVKTLNRIISINVKSLCDRYTCGKTLDHGLANQMKNALIKAMDIDVDRMAYAINKRHLEPTGITLSQNLVEFKERLHHKSTCMVNEAMELLIKGDDKAQDKFISRMCSFFASSMDLSLDKGIEFDITLEF